MHPRLQTLCAGIYSKCPARARTRTRTGSGSGRVPVRVRAVRLRAGEGQRGPEPVLVRGSVVGVGLEGSPFFFFFWGGEGGGEGGPKLSVRGAGLWGLGWWRFGLGLGLGCFFFFFWGGGKEVSVRVRGLWCLERGGGGELLPFFFFFLGGGGSKLGMTMPHFFIHPLNAHSFFP